METMDTLCNACQLGPRKVAGHFDLLVQSIGDGVLAFKCRSCQALWTRRRKPKGEYFWETITERRLHQPSMGVVIPPRSEAHYDPR